MVPCNAPTPRYGLTVSASASSGAGPDGAMLNSPAEARSALGAAAGGARVVTVPRATHLMPLTHPEQLARILLDITVPGGTQGPLPTMEG